MNNNPVSDYGSIVYGERFIGRMDEMRSIKERVLQNNYGNIAIMGLPRIGKSSLVWNTLMVNSLELEQKNTVVIWKNIGEYENSDWLYKDLMIDIIETVKRICEGSIHDKFIDDITTSPDKNDRKRYIKKALREYRQRKIKIIVVLDEFDNSKKILSLHDYQYLRELSYNPETKLCLITISRRTLQEIEVSAGGISNFYQTFSDLNLGMFSNEDIRTYWEKLESYGFDSTSTHRDSVAYYAGRHPFLLDVVNSVLISNDVSFDCESPDKLKGIESFRLKIFNEYLNIINLMVDEKIDQKIVQLLVGPTYDLTLRDVEKMLQYGLIKKDNGIFHAFSEYFEEYLSLISSNIDIWPLWSSVESELRSLVKTYLRENYGEPWEEKYQKKWNINLDSCRNKMIKSIRSFGERASTHLVDYTYPKDIFDLFLAPEWQWYKRILGKDKAEWNKIFSHLSKVRTPIAHSNLNFLTESDKTTATAYCQQILELIQKNDSLILKKAR